AGGEKPSLPRPHRIARTPWQVSQRLDVWWGRHAAPPDAPARRPYLRVHVRDRLKEEGGHLAAPAPSQPHIRFSISDPSRSSGSSLHLRLPRGAAAYRASRNRPPMRVVLSARAGL